MTRLHPTLALAAALCLAGAAGWPPRSARPTPSPSSVPSGTRMAGIPVTSAIVGMMAGASSVGGSGWSGMEIGWSGRDDAGSATASGWSAGARVPRAKWERKGERLQHRGDRLEHRGERLERRRAVERRGERARGAHGHHGDGDI